MTAPSLLPKRGRGRQNVAAEAQYQKQVAAFCKSRSSRFNEEEWTFPPRSSGPALLAFLFWLVASHVTKFGCIKSDASDCVRIVEEVGVAMLFRPGGVVSASGWTNSVRLKASYMRPPDHGQNPLSERSEKGEIPPMFMSAIALAAILMAAQPQAVMVHDGDHHANSDPKMKAWFDGLASKRELCCSFADGSTVNDVDWDTLNGHYRVRLQQEWVVVPDAAVITGLIEWAFQSYGHI